MYPQESDTMPTVLVGESYLLELISTGAPLPEVLNRICAALDVQVGNVVSVALSSKDNQLALNELAEQAAEFGLYVFSCCAIVSKNDELLGTLETYCCLPQDPTADEAALIERASQLAALAIQWNGRKRGRWSFTLPWTGAAERNSPKGHLSEN